MTNLKMTVKAGCPVSVWSPVSSSLKAFAHWLSLEGGDLWTEICVLPSPHPTRSGCFPFCPSCLFFGFWATNNRPHFYNSSLAPTVGLLHLHDIWLSGGFPSSDSSHHNLPRWLQGAHCSWLAGSETGIWGDVSSSYQNNLFQRSSLFLPCSTLGANLHFFLVEQKRASGWAEELQDWVAYQCAPGGSSLLNTKCYLSILPIGYDVCLLLRTICVGEVFVWDSLSVNISEDLWQFFWCVNVVFHLCDQYLCSLL